MSGDFTAWFESQAESEAQQHFDAQQHFNAQHFDAQQHFDGQEQLDDQNEYDDLFYHGLVMNNEAAGEAQSGQVHSNTLQNNLGVNDTAENTPTRMVTDRDSTAPLPTAQEFLDGLETVNLNVLFAGYGTNKATIWTCAVCTNSLPGPGGDIDFPKKIPGCGHVFHQKCIETVMKSLVETRHLCPECRTAFPCQLYELTERQELERSAEQSAINWRAVDVMFNVRAFVWLILRIYDAFHLVTGPSGDGKFLPIVERIINGEDGQDPELSFHGKFGKSAIMCIDQVRYGVTWLQFVVCTALCAHVERMRMPLTDEIEQLIVYRDLKEKEFAQIFAARGLQAHAAGSPSSETPEEDTPTSEVANEEQEDEDDAHNEQEDEDEEDTIVVVL